MVQQLRGICIQFDDIIIAANFGSIWAYTHAQVCCFPENLQEWFSDISS